MTKEQYEKTNVWANTIFDLGTIVVVAALMYLKVIEVEVGTVIIVIISGIWKKMQSSGALKDPPAGLVVGFGAPLLELIRRMKGFVLPLAFIWFIGCSSTQAMDNLVTALDLMTSQNNPIIQTVQVTCAAREWEAIQKEKPEQELIIIREKCDAVYTAHDDWIKAYGKVVEAIDQEQEDMILPYFLECQNASKRFLKAVEDLE